MNTLETSTDDAVALLIRVETATLGHMLDGGFMSPAIQQLFEGPRVCGPALTVRTGPRDGSAIVEAIAAAGPGDVLVIEREGDDRHACWGAVLTAAALAAGVAGVVIDGYVTDAGAIRASGLPVWCRGRSPLTTKAGGSGEGVNADILCAGVAVGPGNLILADENGVCVIDPLQARSLAEEALRMQAWEPALIARLAGGEDVERVLLSETSSFARVDRELVGGVPEAGDGIIEVPILSEALRRLGAPVSALARVSGLLLTCGMPPLHTKTGLIVEGDIRIQTHAVLDALEHVLRHAGASLGDVVKANVFVTDPAFVSAVNEVYQLRFTSHFPVRTTIAVSPWTAPFDIEIECIAIDQARRRGSAR